MDCKSLLQDIVKETGIVNNIFDMKYQMELSEKKNKVLEQIKNNNRKKEYHYGYGSFHPVSYDNNTLIIENISKKEYSVITDYVDKTEVDKYPLSQCDKCSDCVAYSCEHYCSICDNLICKECIVEGEYEVYCKECFYDGREENDTYDTYDTDDTDDTYDTYEIYN